MKQVPVKLLYKLVNENIHHMTLTLYLIEVDMITTYKCTLVL